MPANEAELEWRAFLPVATPTQGNRGNSIASAAGLIAAPTGFLSDVTGALAVTLIPLPYIGFAGTIAFRPLAAFTGAAGGVATATNKPIGLAFTAVIGRILFLTYDPVTELWYPSY